MKRGDRGQVTVFIIIAILLVAAIALFFFYYAKSRVQLSQPSFEEPQAYIEKCARDAAYSATESLLRQGGDSNPKNYRLYQGEKITYLCYTNIYYRSCVMQQPLFIEHLQEEIKSNITSVIEGCFRTLESELKDKNYDVNMGTMDINARLLPGFARVEINRDFTMSRNGETRNYNKFVSAFNSPLYKLARIAMEIASQEANYCYAEYLGLMILYPDLDIDKKAVGQGESASKIYTIEDRDTGKRMNIAIRSCAVPPGF
jgi:hypothetical protein